MGEILVLVWVGWNLMRNIDFCSSYNLNIRYHIYFKEMYIYIDYFLVILFNFGSVLFQGNIKNYVDNTELFCVYLVNL